MAAGNSSRARYYSISEGRICQQFKEATADTISRVNKKGRTVHEQFFDYLDGIITEISTKDTEWGKFWRVTLQDEDITQVLEFNYSSGYATAFLKILPNLDLKAKVKIAPKIQIEGDKKKTSVFIMQHGHAVKWFWNKDNPGKLPPLKKQKVKGKEVWDDSDQMEYLEEYVKKLKPQLDINKEAKPAPLKAAPILDPKDFEGGDADEPGEYDPADDQIPF